MELLRNRVKGAIDDIGGEHVRRIRIGIAQEICKAHGWKRVVIIEEAFVELHHDLNDGLGLRECPWIDEASNQSTTTAKVRNSVKAGSRKLQTPLSTFRWCLIAEDIEISTTSVK